MKSERRRIWKCLIFVVLLTVLAFVSVGCVSAATTYYVIPGESIQAAVTTADPGDTVVVRDGTYTENVEVNVANLTLRSENGSAFTTVVAAINTSDVFLVTANSVTITGFTVRNAIDSASGIHLHSVHHCTVSGNNASDNYRGIYLYSSSNNNLTGNTANSNKQPSIYLYSSSNNNLTGNTANSNNFYGIYLHSSSNNNNLTGNTANSNNFYGIYLDSSSNNNNLTGNTADSNNYRGIFLWSSSNNNLTDNTASNNSYGIYLDYYSSNNSLTGNTALNNSYHGISLYSSSNNNNLTGNTALNNSYHGISLYSSSNNNNLTGNTISNNSNSGIYLDYYSSNNSLTGNNVSNNYRGVYLSSSSNDNHIYNNYFDNAINAYDDGNNTWNISKTSGTNIISGLWLGGNYWSDYTGKDTDSDGIGNTRLPYNSSGNILNGGDCLPLVYPPIFDTNEGNYPSISGNHNGTITPFYDINVSVLYTYPCPGTGGQAEYVKIWNSTTWWNVTATWDGYTGDWHNLTFNNSFTLYANETYNYTIRTGSYPQIIHEPSWNATGGVITCTEFVDLNGQQHEGWIPAIRLC